MNGRLGPRRLCLTASFLAAAPAFAAVVLADSPGTPVTVRVGGQPVPFVVSPFVGDGGVPYTPVDLVYRMGGSYTPNADGTVTVVSDAGARSTFPYRMVRGRYCVPVQRVADALGASTSWDAPSHTMTLRARLVMVRHDASGLNIYTSFPVYYTVNRIGHPNRVYVDLKGVDLAPSSISSTSPDITGIRTGKMDFDTARIVIDLRRDVTYKIASGIQTDHVLVAMGAGGAAPQRPSPVQAAPPAHVAEAPRPSLSAATARPPSSTVSAVPIRPSPPVTASPAPAPSTTESTGQAPSASLPTVTGITVATISDTLTRVTVTATGPAKYRTVTLSGPSRLALDLAGAQLAPGLDTIATSNNALIKQVRTGILNTTNTRFGRIVLDLAKLVDFSVTTQGDGAGVTYMINLQTAASAAPAFSGSALRGRVVMVDPGHGGPDTGAVGIGSAYEKDLTLMIGKRVRDTLVRNGATVFMTREDDVLPSVDQRPRMAIAVGADYFVSIHCDESGETNSHSGTTVYYHAHNPVCKRLAECIVNRVGAVSGIPPLGTKSDTIRFQTGFGVLRGSPMPAVLVECGYMNNEDDLSKLRDEDVQQKIADGIVAGLIDFNAERGGH